MAERRYGPTNGAGTVIIEKDAEKQIEKGALGTTVYLGVLEKGPVGQLFKCATKQDFLAKAGGYIKESTLPDSAFDFFNLGRASGDLYCVRVTDGTEVQSEVTLYGRKNVGFEKTLSADCVGHQVFVSQADYLALGSPKVSSLVVLSSEDLGDSPILQVTAVDYATPSVGTVRLTLSGSVAYLSGDKITAYSSAIRPAVMKFKAANGGRWGGKKDIIFGTAFGLGGLTEFSFDTGKPALEDYFVDALIRFAAMPGKAYRVVSNDATGVLYVSADSTMATDYAASGSSDTTWSVQLDNNSKALAVKVVDGISYPTTRFGVEVYCDGIRCLVYDDLTLDPKDKTYYRDLINDDDANVYVEVEDLWFGDYTPEVRPANVFGQNFGISNTVLTGRAVAASFQGSGNGIIDAFTYGGTVQEDTIEVECTDAGALASGLVQIASNVFDLTSPEVVGSDVTGSYALGDFTGCVHNKLFVNLYGQGVVEVVVSLPACVDGAATATELTTKINAALASAGKVGSVLVVYDTDHFKVTATAKGKDLALVLSDTGLTGGSLASELKVSASTYSNYTAGTGDYLRLTFGAIVADFVFVSGVSPVAVGKVLVGGSVSLTAEALLQAILGYSAIAGLVTAVRSDDTVTITATKPHAAVGWSIVEFDGTTDNLTVVSFSGGADQLWSYLSAELGLLVGSVPKTDVAFVTPNDFGVGFKLSSGSVLFALGDKFTLVVRPWATNSMVGGQLYPDVLNAPRSKYEIIANTANTITVKPTSTMRDVARLGSTYRVEFLEEMAGGYDGLVGVSDSDYLNLLDSSTSPINSLFGEMKGLVKVGIPGVTATAVQKAGLAYAEARNYQFRVQIPSNIVSEDAAESYINDTIGRNDFGVVSFPSWMYVPHPTASGLKLVPTIGAIQGREALWAKNYSGYHKAAAGVDCTIPNCVRLPTGDRVLDEELLNKHGIGVIKSKSGNFIIWGDRTISIDPSWKWKHQREMMSFYENDLREAFDWIIFAINDKVEQKKALSALYSYFIPEFQKRALRGDTFEDAVSIKLDDENNTNLSMANGDMNAEISLRLADTVERFIITMSKRGIFD